MFAMMMTWNGFRAYDQSTISLFRGFRGVTADRAVEAWLRDHFQSIPNQSAKRWTLFSPR